MIRLNKIRFDYIRLIIVWKTTHCDISGCSSFMSFVGIYGGLLTRISNLSSSSLSPTNWSVNNIEKNMVNPAPLKILFVRPSLISYYSSIFKKNSSLLHFFKANSFFHLRWCPTQWCFIRSPKQKRNNLLAKPLKHPWNHSEIDTIKYCWQLSYQKTDYRLKLSTINQA